MILAGVGAAAAIAVDGVPTAVAAVLLIQLQILFDCSDGELARWRGQSSPVGIYLDRLGHWITESALPIALGIRVDEPVLGLVVAVLVLFVKGETALVHVARTEAGLGKVEDSVAVAAPRGGLLATLRRSAGRLPFYRAFVAIEFTALVLVASLLDVERELLVALVAVAAVTALGHLIAILTSQRLR
jgi:phosphatidylglycerophosphate synthase